MQHRLARQASSWKAILEKTLGYKAPKTSDKTRPSFKQFATALAAALHQHQILLARFNQPWQSDECKGLNKIMKDSWADGVLMSGGMNITLPFSKGRETDCTRKIREIYDDLLDAVELLIAIMDSGAIATVNDLAIKDKENNNGKTPTLSGFFSEGQCTVYLDELDFTAVNRAFSVAEPAVITLQDDLNELTATVDRIRRGMQQLSVMESVVEEQLNYISILSLSALFIEYFSYVNGEGPFVDDEQYPEAAKLLSTRFQQMSLSDIFNVTVVESIKFIIDKQRTSLVESLQAINSNYEYGRALPRLHLVCLNVTYLAAYFPKLEIDSRIYVETLLKEMRVNDFFDDVAFKLLEPQLLWPNSDSITYPDYFNVINDPDSLIGGLTKFFTRSNVRPAVIAISSPLMRHNTQKLDSAADLCERFFWSDSQNVGVYSLLPRIRSLIIKSMANESTPLSREVGKSYDKLLSACRIANREIRHQDDKYRDAQAFTNRLQPVSAALGLFQSVAAKCKNRVVNEKIMVIVQRLQALRAKLEELAKQDQRDKVEEVLALEIAPSEITIVGGECDVEIVYSDDSNGAGVNADSVDITTVNAIALATAAAETARQCDGASTKTATDIESNRAVALAAQMAEAEIKAKQAVAISKLNEKVQQGKLARRRHRDNIVLFRQDPEKPPRPNTEVDTRRFLPQAIVQKIMLDCAKATPHKTTQATKNAKLFGGAKQACYRAVIDLDYKNAFLHGQSKLFLSTMKDFLISQGFKDDEVLKLDAQLAGRFSRAFLFDQCCQKYIADHLQVYQLHEVSIKMSADGRHIDFYMAPTNHKAFVDCLTEKTYEDTADLLQQYS